jgi:hypothetical protein
VQECSSRNGMLRVIAPSQSALFARGFYWITPQAIRPPASPVGSVL